MSLYWISRSYVFVVLEHHKGKKDAVVHGVYTARSMAEGKKDKIAATPKSGYVSILKKPIQGKVKRAFDWGR